MSEKYIRKDPNQTILIDGKPYVSLNDMALRVNMVHAHLRLLARTRTELGAKKRGRRWYFNVEKTERALETLYAETGNISDGDNGRADLIADL